MIGVSTAIPAAALLDGVLNVRKDAGWTSHDVVAKVRRALRGRRVGHAGTLDPAATGVLPLLLGRATRIAEYLLDWDKEYRAVLRLGETTDTLDATGTTLERRPTGHLTEVAIRDAVGLFQGVIRQVPPMFSAVKVGGVPLYKAARAGRSVMREAREVVIHRLEVQRIEGADVTLLVVCSKGTYIRTLCADIGAALAVGGHVRALERLRVGPLKLADALSVDEVCHLASDAMGGLRPKLLSLDDALAGLPAVVVGEAAGRRVRHGVPVPSEAVIWDRSSAPSELAKGGVVRVKDMEGRLLALGSVAGWRAGEAAPSGSVKINKVLSE